MTRLPHLHAAVFGLIINKNDEILLLKRKNTGYYDGGYSLPAGHVEDGEFASIAIVKEMKEELWIDIDTKNRKPFHTIHRIATDRQYIDIAYLITERTGEIVNTEPEKCEALERHHKDKLPNYITGEAKRFIEAYFSGETFSELTTIVPTQ